MVRCLQFAVMLGCCLLLTFGMTCGNLAIAATLDGAIEFHGYSAPDVTPHLYDDIELVHKAADAGMTAIVLNNHVTPTADRAVLAHKLVPNIEVYGGIVLNETVGGLNLKAVEAMTKLGREHSKVVWLPTIDAAYYRKMFNKGTGGFHVTRGDRLLPRLKPIFEFMADHDLVLGTGYVSPIEVMVAVCQAKQMGLNKILVTHAMAIVPGLTLEQMQFVANQGAFLELTYVSTFMGTHADAADHYAGDHVSIEDMVKAIKTIGAEHFVLSTALGRTLDPSPIDGYQAFVDKLATAGISEAELRLMSHTNPLSLLE